MKLFIHIASLVVIQTCMLLINGVETISMLRMKIDPFNHLVHTLRASGCVKCHQHLYRRASGNAPS
jgi:hypothetical protein